MSITINSDYQKVYKDATAMVDSSRGNVLHFKETGSWDTFEEIIGFPHQFNDNADPQKVKSGGKVPNNYGRVFSNTIISDCNIVFIEPGLPKFMPAKYLESQKNKELKQQMLKALNLNDDDSIQGLFSANAFKHDSRYYVFQSAFGDYMSFVNSMCTYVAARLGLDKEDESLANIKTMRLSQGGNTFTKTSIPFYFDAASTSYSEGASNSTTESKLASAMSTMGSTIREANFLLNRASSDDSILSTASNFISEKLGALAGKIPGIGDTLDSLLSNASLSLQGANLMFPEIWSDSSFKKNITLGFKFVSPYGDKLSIYNNVIFPTICLLGLTMPRQAKKGTMGYLSPFLVKVFSKGWFNCDLGMIGDLDINRGPGNAWSVDGLPLEVTASVTIKDLYSTIMMTQGSGTLLLNNNTGLSEYLETWAAMQITNPDIFGDFKNNIQEALWNVSNGINKKITDIETSFLGKTFSAGKEYLDATLSKIDELFFTDDTSDQTVESNQDQNNN